jgi:phosphoglycerate dehydrogenase-like enzyme
MSGCRIMRIHIQNLPDDPLFDVTLDQWAGAVARAPDVGLGHEVTIAKDDEGFASAAPDTEALILATQDVRDRLIGHAPFSAPRLRLLFVTSAGLDQLAPFDWLPSGVTLLNNSGTHGLKASEYVIMAVLMLSNGIPALAASQRAATWRKLYAPVLSGRRQTVVGLGAIGGAVAWQAARFGMRVVGVRARPAPHPSCERVVAVGDLDFALTDTEFLVVACPLTNATFRLLDRRRLGLLPPGAGLINVGRGAVVDEEALCDLLETDHVGGAVVDVFATEPIPPDSRLWRTRNLVITPHVAADDPATYNRQSLDIFLANLRTLRAGRPLPNRFDAARGY